MVYIGQCLHATLCLCSVVIILLECPTEGVLAKVKKDDRLVLMGDLNGRVGRDVETWEEVIGRHGEETQNDNGRRFLGSCTTNGLTIMNGCFEHKEIHKQHGSVGVVACIPSLNTSQYERTLDQQWQV